MPYTFNPQIQLCQFPLLPPGLDRMERLGYGAIPPAAGLAAITNLLGCLAGQSVVDTAPALPPVLVGAVFHWDRLNISSRLFSELKRPSPRLQLAHTDGACTASAAPTASSASSSSSAPPAAAPALALPGIRALVSEAVVSVLGSDPGPDAPLVGAGIDSLGEFHAAWLNACLVAGGKVDCWAGTPTF